jgi:hypothetical protein
MQNEKKMEPPIMHQEARRINTGRPRKRLKVEAATGSSLMSLSEDNDKLQFNALGTEILEVKNHIKSYCEECSKRF